LLSKHAPIARLLVISFVCLSFAGCGGDLGAPSGFLTRAVGFDVTWGPKISRASRAGDPVLHAPAEAQSAEMFLVGANQDGTEYRQVVVRDSNETGVYTDSYDVNNPVKTGGTLFRARFYLTPVPTDNPADLIGEIKPTPVLINPTGQTSILVSTITVPKAVIITPGQTLRVNQTSSIKYSVIDDKGNLVVQSTTIAAAKLATAPNPSDIVAVAPQPESEDQLKGLKQGTVQVTATIQYIKVVGNTVTINNFLTSAPETVSVVTTTVTVNPTDVPVFTGAIQQFNANVANDDLFNSGVTWSVQEGAAGGTIDANGRYTAPAAAGTYHVIATSKADTNRTATAIVRVTIPEHSGGAGFIIK
jgi:hypothetical protein